MKAMAHQPRKGRPRTQRIPVDHGTPELAAKRLMLVGNADPALSEYPLGILFARGVIDQDQRNAGDRYAKTYAMAIGRKSELGFDMDGKDDIDDETLSRIEAQHDACQKALRKKGGHVFRITERVCVYREFRPWMVPQHGSTAGADDRHWLKTGLDELVKLLIGRKAA